MAPRVSALGPPIEPELPHWRPATRPAATEAMSLMMQHAFEGVFRQAIVCKGRNRDTQWYSILDTEWAALDAAFRAWLDPANFDGQGRQLRSLASCREAR